KNMTPDEIIYATLLVISLPLGHLIKKIDDARTKQLYSSIIGVTMVAVVCKEHTLHSITTSLVTCLIITISKKYCHIATFVWCFGYLVFFRTTHYCGLPKVNGPSNAVQLLLTLKMIGLAFEVHDTIIQRKTIEGKTKNEEEEKKLQLQLEFQGVNPSFIDMICYSYCFIGLLTGPYYRYRTYHDMLHQKNPEKVPSFEPLMKRLKFAPLYGLLFLVTSAYFSLEYMNTDDFMEKPFWYRLFYMVPMFTVFRMRMYTAWVMSECMCMASGLGAYPKASKPKCGLGPSDLEALKQISEEGNWDCEYDYETIHNINEYGCELAPTIRDGMRSWNMSVQYWLATFIYRRVPIKAVRTSITMLVSAFWHGIHPGYYLSFLTIPPSLMAEDIMKSTFRSKYTERGQKIFDWCLWFYKQRSLDYMCMGFLLLGFNETIRYWGSIYFAMHAVTGILIIVGNVFASTAKVEKKSD
ncbi:unnamed protein product, partial [Owenia fusiformis]